MHKHGPLAPYSHCTSWTCNIDYPNFIEVFEGQHGWKGIDLSRLAVNHVIVKMNLTHDHGQHLTLWTLCNNDTLLTKLVRGMQQAYFTGISMQCFQVRILTSQGTTREYVAWFADLDGVTVEQVGLTCWDCIDVHIFALKDHKMQLRSETMTHVAHGRNVPVAASPTPLYENIAVGGFQVPDADAQVKVAMLAPQP